MPINRSVLMIAGLLLAEAAAIAGLASAGNRLPSACIPVGANEVVIEVHDQQAYRAVCIARVVTPVDGWVIVRAGGGDGRPAALIGAAPVRAGENRNVSVVTGPSATLPVGAYVSVVADRGALGKFEYATGNPADRFSLASNPGGSMMGAPAAAEPQVTEVVDWPLVAGGEQVSSSFAITPFDVTYRVPDANIADVYLGAGGRVATAVSIDAPRDSWVVAIRVGRGGEDGNEVIGAAQVPAGRTDRVEIPISAVIDGSEVSALLVADLGAPGVLEVDPVDPTRSVDAPYLVRSWFVWKLAAPTH